MSEAVPGDLNELKAIEEICSRIVIFIEQMKAVSADHDDIKERMCRLRRNVSIKLAKGERWNAHEVRELQKELLLVTEKLLEKEKALLEKEQVLIARIAEYKEQEKKARLYKLWKLKMQSMEWPNPSNPKPDEL